MAGCFPVVGGCEEIMHGATNRRSTNSSKFNELADTFVVHLLDLTQSNKIHILRSRCNSWFVALWTPVLAASGNFAHCKSYLEILSATCVYTVMLIKKWLQLRHDCDSTAARLPSDFQLPFNAWKSHGSHATVKLQ